MPQSLEAFDGLPSPAPVRSHDVIETLGDDLVLRRAREADIEAIAAFNAVVHADPPDFEVLEHIANWSRQLMDGSHPTARAGDFLLVHDTRRNRVASSLCLLSHRLAYDGIELPCGMPELVGTHPDYRHARLVARQFDAIHRRSDERGDALQIIDGIPWYYRQYGYEMAAQRQGGWIVPEQALPTTGPRGVRVRRAGIGDEPFLDSAYRHAMRRYRLTCLRDEAFWRFEVAGRSAFSTQTRFLYIVESEAGDPLGVFNAVPILLDGGHTWTSLCESAPDVGWQRIAEAVLFFLRDIGLEIARRDDTPLVGAGLILGVDHPLYTVLANREGRARPPYAWYVRVPDLAGFVRTIAPALEARLAASPQAGVTGTLSWSDYRRGVRLHLEKGRVCDVSTWRPATDDRGDVGFPDRTFLHLLFGHRSLALLEAAFPDCCVFEESQRVLVDALFPARPSFIMATT